MSIDFSNAKITKLITHYVGNKYNSETFFYSEECVKIGSSEMQDVLLTGGGIIPDEDAKKLNELGVGKLFPPGTNTSAIADYIKIWVKEKRNF